MGCIQFNYHVSSSFHFPGRHPFSKNPMSMYASLEGEVMKIDELSMNMEFCKSQLIPQGNPISLSTKMHGPKKNWTSTWSKSTCSIINTVDGWNPAITSWGNGSWNPMIYKVLYIPRWRSPDFWTINSITSQASRKTPWDTTSCWRFCWG